MFTILNNCCCAYFCPWLYDDDTDSDVSDATTVDTHMPYHRFKNKKVIFQDNPLLSSDEMTRS
jgi:hypothetical protein